VLALCRVSEPRLPVGDLSGWQLALIPAAVLNLRPGWTLDAASLQFKWLYQFQFAGHDAALEQSFYRDSHCPTTHCMLARERCGPLAATKS
jgi:hypothetical protein